MANTTENINYKITVDGNTGTAVVRDLKGQIIATKVPVKQLREEFGNFAKTVNATNFNKFNAGLKTASTANKNLGDASGAATSSVMELSRVVSDAPYGIRGMANNITQLVSQMGFAAKKAGGFGGALKEMGKQFMGPLGIVFLVTAAVSALDFFYGAAKKAEKAVKDLTRETYANTLVAKQYVQELEDVNITEERRKVVTQELIKLVPTLTEQDLKYGENLDKVRLKINSYALAQASRIEIDKLVQENSESLSFKNELESIKKIEDAEERISRMKKFILETGKDVSGFILGFGDEGLIKKGDVDQIEETFRRLGRVIDKESEPILTRINELTQSLELDPDKTKNKKTKLLEIKDFDKQVEDYLSQIASVSEKEEILNAKLNSDKILIQEEYHLKNLDIKNEENKAKFKQQSDAYRIEYEAFLNQEVALGNLTKKEAKVKLNKFDIDAKAQQDKSDANYKILLSKWNTYYTDKLFAALSGEMKVAETEEDANAKRLKAITDFIEQYKVLTSAVNDFLQAESERELTIEQNKTNVLNTELNNRLNNENLSAEQRKSIQDEILRNDEKLRVKQNAIKKKAFMTQKAFNISTAIVNTVSAGIGAAAATYGGPIAKLAAMTAVIGAGMAQVAIIARQKFQPEAANTPVNTGGGGSSSGVSSVRSEPSFNIVGGRTKEDALLGAIQAKFDQPVRAWVVSGDITSQQELDRVIVSSSSL